MRCPGQVFCFFALGTSALLTAGCGEGGPDNLAAVSGQVKLDGQPLEGARLEFIPTEGAVSLGKTDAQGKYELLFNRDDKGAVIGQHKVRISTYSPGDPDDPATPAVPEKLPAKYNVKSELTQTVEKGSNTIDFELDGNGEIIDPEKLARSRGD
jgi:hypothetical protein